jgi:hypothetical protein
MVTLSVDVRGAMPPKPPLELSDSQATTWRDVCGSMPSGWLKRGAYPLLVEYTRKVGRLRTLEQQITNFEIEWTRVDGGLERLNLLLAAADRECKAIVNLARALRISPQAQLDPQTHGRRVASLPASASRPWDRAPVAGDGDA